MYNQKWILIVDHQFRKASSPGNPKLYSRRELSLAEIPDSVRNATTVERQSNRKRQ